MCRRTASDRTLEEVLKPRSQLKNQFRVKGPVTEVKLKGQMTKLKGNFAAVLTNLGLMISGK